METLGKLFIVLFCAIISLILAAVFVSLSEHPFVFIFMFLFTMFATFTLVVVIRNKIIGPSDDALSEDFFGQPHLVLFMLFYKNKTGIILGIDRAKALMVPIFQKAEQLKAQLALNESDMAAKNKVMFDIIDMYNAKTGKTLTATEAEDIFWFITAIGECEKEKGADSKNQMRDSMDFVRRLCEEAERNVGNFEALQPLQEDSTPASDEAIPNRDIEEFSSGEIVKALKFILKKRRASVAVLAQLLGSSAKSNKMLAVLEEGGLVQRPVGSNQCIVNFTKIEAYLHRHG